MRGNYWRDRNTRVLAPEIEFSKQLPSGTTIGGGYLLDAISSASMAAGALTDEVFTELRHDVRVSIGQRIGPATLSGRYRYSTESDYWSHSAGLSAAIDLFKKNLTLAASYSFGHDDVARRVGPTGFVKVGHLQSHFGLGSATVVLSRLALLDLTYEFVRAGDFKDKLSFLGNPYRPVMVSGTPQVEAVPLERTRHTAMLGLRVALPLPPGLVRHFVLHGKYRFYTDDWGVIAHTPELRTYVAIGPLDLRITGRYHTQRGATFFRRNASFLPEYGLDSIDADGKPAPAPAGVQHRNCPGGANGSPLGNCYTGDAKLATSSSLYFELRASLPLRVLDFPRMPLGKWLGEGTLSLSYGHYVNDYFLHRQYGDADVAATELTFPL